MQCDLDHHVGLVVDVWHDADQPLDRPDVLGDAILGSVELIQGHVVLHLVDGVAAALEILHGVLVLQLRKLSNYKLIILVVDRVGV